MEFAQQVFDWVKTQVIENDFASGAVLTVVASFILLQLRSLPKKIYGFFKYMTVYTFYIESSDTYFVEIQEWSNQYIKSPVRYEEYQDGKMINKQGKSWGWIGKLPISVSVNQRDLEMAAESTGRSKVIQMNITCPLWGKRKLNKAIKEYIDVKMDNNHIKIYKSNNNGYFTGPLKRLRRPISTVFMDHKVKNKILKFCKSFYESKKWYIDTGQPWRRGVFLEGSPGNGKTSLIFGLATELDSHVYIVSLVSKFIDDAKILEFFSEIVPGSIIVLEDLDRIFTDDKKLIDGVSFSLSSLLNAIDGITSSEGRILIATGNDISKIPDALLRPGRFDLIELIPSPTDTSIREMMELLAPDMTEEQAQKIIKMNYESMAAVKGAIVDEINT